MLSDAGARRQAGAGVHAISQQPRQFDQLRDARQFLSFRALQVKSQVAAECIGQGEGFAEVDPGLRC